jgi:hypothetical protein
LNEGLHRKLALISAPAGFGKTTLVSEWVDNLRLDAANENQIVYRIAWVSLDEGDNDPVRFLAYFVAALSRVEGIEATIGGGALGMLQFPQPPPTEAVPLGESFSTEHDHFTGNERGKGWSFLDYTIASCRRRMFWIAGRSINFLPEDQWLFSFSINQTSRCEINQQLVVAIVIFFAANA